MRKRDDIYFFQKTELSIQFREQTAADGTERQKGSVSRFSLVSMHALCLAPNIMMHDDVLTAATPAKNSLCWSKTRSIPAEMVRHALPKRHHP